MASQPPTVSWEDHFSAKSKNSRRESLHKETESKLHHHCNCGEPTMVYFMQKPDEIERYEKKIFLYLKALFPIITTPYSLLRASCPSNVRKVLRVASLSFANERSTATKSVTIEYRNAEVFNTADKISRAYMTRLGRPKGVSTEYQLLMI